MSFSTKLCLCIVGQAESGYPTVMLSVLNTVVMMVGDMNYMDTFMTPYTDDDPGTLHYGGLAFFILSLFLLLIPILLMNLLVSKVIQLNVLITMLYVY